jgi:uncharacterized protein YajQ (UPF0234 family)
MPSFNIVSEIDWVEVKNAADNANRELETRFDFRGVEAKIELQDQVVNLSCEGDFQLKQLLDMLRKSCTKRNLPAAFLASQTIERSGKTYKQRIQFKEGIDKPTAKKIVQLIKNAKLKVQATIEGDKIRVTGKKRDDLQQTINLIKATDLEQPLQYINFRD